MTRESGTRVKHEQQWEHFWQAIPDQREAALSANQIFNRQQKIRLPRVQVYEHLERFVRQGQVEGISVGHMRYYRKRAIADSSIATPVTPTYNGTARSESSPEKADNFLRVLAPLNTGKSVALWMDHPRAVRKNAENRRQLVVLIPGPVAGLPKGTVLVCVVGSGSCIVKADAPTKVADLVLAGIPAKLATSLMDSVHRAMKT